MLKDADAWRHTFRPGPGAYIRGANREELFKILRAKGVGMAQAARLLHYTLREAYDLSRKQYRYSNGYIADTTTNTKTH